MTHPLSSAVWKTLNGFAVITVSVAILWQEAWDEQQWFLRWAGVMLRKYQRRLQRRSRPLQRELTAHLKRFSLQAISVTIAAIRPKAEAFLAHLGKTVEPLRHTSFLLHVRTTFPRKLTEKQQTWAAWRAWIHKTIRKTLRSTFTEHSSER